MPVLIHFIGGMFDGEILIDPNIQPVHESKQFAWAFYGATKGQVDAVSGITSANYRIESNVKRDGQETIVARLVAVPRNLFLAA